MTRSAVVAAAGDYFDSGDFLADLRRRVAFRTETGTAADRPDLLAYLNEQREATRVVEGVDLAYQAVDRIDWLMRRFRRASLRRRRLTARNILLM